MENLIWQTIYFFLPAGVANMAPLLSRLLPFHAISADFGRSWRGRRIFGDNKTWRGVIFGILGGMFGARLLFGGAFRVPASWQLFEYGQFNILLLGCLLGLGAVLGDLIKSFFKRQLDIAPGKSWWFFDQVDWIIGSYCAVAFYAKLNLIVLPIAIVIFGILHVVINYLGYWVGVKRNKF